MAGKSKQDNKRELKPKLRFPEFRDAGDWDSQPLGNAATIHKGKGVSKADLADDGVQHCIRYGELYTRYGEVINEVLSRTNVPADELVLSRKHDVIIPASGETKADIATAACVMLDDVALGSDLNIVRSELHGPFFSYYLNGSKRFDIAKVAQGDTVAHLYPGQLEKIEISYPSLAEQTKIAGCLSSLDELIAAESRKLETLQAHKKGLMQQLFPQEGETVPRLRFPEFKGAGEWKQIAFWELGFDVSDGNYSSKYPTQSDFAEAGVPFLRANNLRFGTLSDEDMRFISIEQHKELTKGHLKKGDLIISTRGQLGIVALVPDRHVGSNINAQLVRINADGKMVNTFLFQLLVYSRTIGLFDSLSTGTALKQLPIGKLNQLRLKFPETRNEQQTIADCLSAIDELITTQSQKNDVLKTHKKGLMQQLFPSLEDAHA